MTDLIRAHSSGFTDASLVRDLMVKNPVALSSEDNCAVASATFCESQLKCLPVVECNESPRKPWGYYDFICNIKLIMLSTVSGLKEISQEEIPHNIKMKSK
jgi:hypothetical protein